MVVLPLALDAVNSRAAARTFLMLSITGQYALLPLLFTRNEYPLKVSVPPLEPLPFYEINISHSSSKMLGTGFFKLLRILSVHVNSQVWQKSSFQGGFTRIVTAEVFKSLHVHADAIVGDLFSGELHFAERLHGAPQRGKWITASARKRSSL